MLRSFSQVITSYTHTTTSLSLVWRQSEIADNSRVLTTEDVNIFPVGVTIGVFVLPVFICIEKLEFLAVESLLVPATGVTIPDDPLVVALDEPCRK